MNTKYFKTIESAEIVAKFVDKSLCKNKYQTKGECQEPVVREFQRKADKVWEKPKFAVQLGDYGDYLE